MSGRRVLPARAALGWTAAAAATPYLALKALWVAGSTIGMADPAFFADSTYRVANLLSFLLDGAAVGVALALIRPWGDRLPPWLVLVPMWVATGLLGTILVLAPAAAPFARASGVGGASDALHSWVYLVVYGGFAVQGVLLLAAFFFYVKRRWPAALTSGWSSTPSTPLLRKIAVLLVAAIGIAIALMHLSWMSGERRGLGATVDEVTPVTRVTFGVHGMFIALAAAGATALALRSPRRLPRWLPVVLLWTGTASMVTWGLYTTALAVWRPALSSPVVTAATVSRVAVAVALIVLACPRPARPDFP